MKKKLPSLYLLSCILLFASTTLAQEVDPSKCTSYSITVHGKKYDIPACTATKFAIIGDTRYPGTSNAQSVINSAKALFMNKWGSDIDYLVTTGDIYDANYNINTQLAPLQGYIGSTWGTNRLWNAIGNHEYYGDPSGAQYDITFPFYPKRYYDVIKGSIHFFFLDLYTSWNAEQSQTDYTELEWNNILLSRSFYSGNVLADDMGKQKQWLTKAVNESSATWKIVVTHYPYGMDFHQFDWDFHAMGVDVVLTGHEHAYLRYTKDNVQYFINGTGGADLYNECASYKNKLHDNLSISTASITCIPTHGYQVVIADDHNLSFEFYNTEQQLKDIRTLHK